MAIAFVQAANNSTVGTATTVTLTTTTGNFLVLAVYQGVNSTSTMAVTDTASNTWVQAGGYVASTGDRFALFYVPNATSVTSVTATWSGSITATVPVVVAEFSGVATGTPLDSNASNPATNTQTGTHTSITSAALSTSNADDVLIYAVGSGTTITGTVGAGSNFTLPTRGNTTNNRCFLTYRIVSATQGNATTTPSYSSTTANQGGIFAAFANTNQTVGHPFEDDSFNASTNSVLVVQSEPIISVW